MKMKTMSYGRTIEVGGPFGRNGRPVEKVWFGWEVELEEGDNEADVTAKLRAQADEREAFERATYEERYRMRRRNEF